MEAEWREIKGFNGVYAINSLGYVKSVDRAIEMADQRPYFKTERLITTQILDNGRVNVRLYDGNRNVKTLKIDDLLNETFPEIFQQKNEDFTERLMDAVKKVVDEDKLQSPSRKRLSNYKRVIIAKILADNDFNNFSISTVLNRVEQNIAHLLRNYKKLKIYGDFQDLEKEILKRIGVKTNEEIFNESLTARVLACKDYWEMTKLQEELKTQL